MNKEQMKIYQKQWAEKNKEHLKKYRKKYNQEHFEQKQKYYKDYYPEHQEQYKRNALNFYNRTCKRPRLNKYADFYAVLKDGEIVKKYESMKELERFMGMPISTMYYYIDKPKLIYGYQLKRIYKGVNENDKN